MNFAVEKAFDIVMDALIEKSKDEIDDILQQSKRKKMLQKTFESFMGHALANTEYSKLAYVNCSESIALSFIFCKAEKVNKVLQLKAFITFTGT